LTRTFQIEWTDFKTVVRVELAENENPRLCQEFWDTLPFKTILAASMSAGEMLKVPLPRMLNAPTEGPLHLFPDEPVGTLLYIGTLGMLLRWGKVVEPFRMARLGLVVKDDLPKLTEVRSSSPTLTFLPR
jgi:hypothetical protein